MTLQPVFRCSSLSILDTGSGREIPATCHDTGVWHAVFTQNPSTGTGQIPGCGFIISVANMSWHRNEEYPHAIFTDESNFADE